MLFHTLALGRPVNHTRPTSVPIFPYCTCYTSCASSPALAWGHVLHRSSVFTFSASCFLSLSFVQNARISYFPSLPHLFCNGDNSLVGRTSYHPVSRRPCSHGHPSGPTVRTIFAGDLGTTSSTAAILALRDLLAICWGKGASVSSSSIISPPGTFRRRSAPLVVLLLAAALLGISMGYLGISGRGISALARERAKPATRHGARNRYTSR